MVLRALESQFWKQCGYVCRTQKCYSSFRLRIGSRRICTTDESWFVKGHLIGIAWWPGWKLWVANLNYFQCHRKNFEFLTTSGSYKLFLSTYGRDVPQRRGRWEKEGCTMGSNWLLVPFLTVFRPSSTECKTMLENLPTWWDEPIL